MRPYTLPAPRGGGGRDGDAVGPAPRRPARRRRCSRCRCRWPRASPPSARPGASSRSRRPRPASPSPTGRRGASSATSTSPRPASRPSKDCTYGLRGLRRLLRRRRRLRAAGQQGRGRARHRREAFVERYNEAGGVVIGTPDDAIEYIEGLIEQSGGFGTFLHARPRLGLARSATHRQLPALRREGHPPLPGPAGRAPGVARLGHREPRQAVRPRRSRRSGTPSPSTSRRRRRTPPRRPRPTPQEEDGLMRAVALQVREDLRQRRRPRAGARLRAGARAGEGVRHLRVRPALRQARRRHDGASPSEMEGMPDGPVRRPGPRPRPGRVHGPRVLGRGARGRPRHRGARRRARSSRRSRSCSSATGIEPIVYSNTTAGGYGERMLLSAADAAPRSPTASTPPRRAHRADGGRPARA